MVIILKTPSQQGAKKLFSGFRSTCWLVLWKCLVGQVRPCHCFWKLVGSWLMHYCRPSAAQEISNPKVWRCSISKGQKTDWLSTYNDKPLLFVYIFGWPMELWNKKSNDQMSFTFGERLPWTTITCDHWASVFPRPSLCREWMEHVMEKWLSFWDMFCWQRQPFFDKRHHFLPWFWANYSHLTFPHPWFL